MGAHILLTTDVIGGVWDFSLTLSRALTERHGARVTLLALGEPSETQRADAARACASLLAEPLKLEWMQAADDDVAATRRLVGQLARELKVDVVHANQFAAACIDVGVPVVLTVHSDVLSWRRWTLGTSDVPDEWRSYTTLVREGLSSASTVVAVSRFMADQVRSCYGFAPNVDVVHNGWPAPATVSSAREPITLLAGRAWDAAKNIQLAAEAARGWDPGCVYLAGETTHPDGGAAQVLAPLQPLGLLGRRELDGWLDRATLYLSPAKYDPFGLLPLQAALRGCALLLSDIPSYREVWGDAARYFSPHDGSDLRRAWQMLLREPGDLAEQARTRAIERYSPDRMADAYAAVYQRVPV